MFSCGCCQQRQSLDHHHLISNRASFEISNKEYEEEKNRVIGEVPFVEEIVSSKAKLSNKPLEDSAKLQNKTFTNKKKAEVNGNEDGENKLGQSRLSERPATSKPRSTTVQKKNERPRTTSYQSRKSSESTERSPKKFRDKTTKSVINAQPATESKWIGNEIASSVIFNFFVHNIQYYM